MHSYRWLFAPLIPHGRNENQSWRNRRLEDTQQHSHRDQRPKILAHAVQSDTNTPKDDVGTQVFTGGKTLHQVACRHLKGEVRDVEHQGQQGELVGVNVRVFKETHDCSVVDWISGRASALLPDGHAHGKPGAVEEEPYSESCPDTASSNITTTMARSSSRSCARASSHRPPSSTSYLHD